VFTSSKAEIRLGPWLLSRAAAARTIYVAVRPRCWITVGDGPPSSPASHSGLILLGCRSTRLGRRAVRVLVPTHPVFFQRAGGFDHFYTIADDGASLRRSVRRPCLDESAWRGRASAARRGLSPSIRVRCARAVQAAVARRRPRPCWSRRNCLPDLFRVMHDRDGPLPAAACCSHTGQCSLARLSQGQARTSRASGPRTSPYRLALACM